MLPLWRHKFLIKLSMTLKVNQSHIRPHLCQNHSSTFVYELILMKICMNANEVPIKFHFHVMEKFYDLLTLIQPWLTFLWATFVLVFTFNHAFYILGHFWFMRQLRGRLNAAGKWVGEMKGSSQLTAERKFHNY